MNRYSRLKKILKSMRSVLVAYSGGVDSTFLLKVALDTLGGKNVLAVTANSPTYAKHELRFSRKMAREIGARQRVIETEELRNSKFAKNPLNRCFYCKNELFSKLKKIAKQEGINFVIDASNAADLLDYRPGAKAKNKLGIRSPLQEAGITKQEIRDLSKKLGLKTWNMPQLACLASRFPYGDKITEEKLRRVEKAESLIRRMGFSDVRVRSYDGLCRIEVARNKIAGLINGMDKKTISKLKKLGYNYIMVDMEGFRSGSMNMGVKK